VSNTEDSPRVLHQEAFQRLEGSVNALLDRVHGLGGRVREAETRRAEAQELVKRFTGDLDEADRLLTRVRELEEENADLRARLGQGRVTVERLLARVRFLEEGR